MRGYIFDLDGTVYLGERLIEGAAEAIRTLRERGDKVVFLSNKPIATRQSYAHKLTKMGIPTELGDILNSSLILARYLKKIVKPGETVYVIGEEPICSELREHGITPRQDEEDIRPQYVVLSWDRQFTYDKLNRLYQAAVNGAVIIASNPDYTCPLENGQIPDTGTFIAALESATGRPIDAVVGKPSPISAAAAVEHLGLAYEDCFMIGDRLETDIKMAHDTGMKSVLVLTGVGTREAAAACAYPPDHIIPSIKEVVHL
ncbi:HAD-IIA family hydrolase [Paenibacillus aurantius]|uniref:Acid sugar phosphatase n=1 Tax=Paenibacillus aurantius TaxID=2918900 RepID=A0AA96RHG3_9BACL|nr:HAD-IIA family hydrolase [Paenibacillus aurantius]WNQ13333.1 HAD-IIA family hydrolase [Paenibacillus aurantius]